MSVHLDESSPAFAGSPVRITTSILNIPIDHVDLAGAIDRIATLIDGGGTHQVATVNPEFVVAAQHNQPFKTVLQQVDVCVADGIGLVLAAQWLKQPLPGRVPGVELCMALAERAMHRGWRIFLLGAGRGVAEQAAARLHAQLPGLIIAGTYAGSPSPTDWPEINARLQAACPDILLVAYGAPAQDLWIAEHQSDLKIPLAMGIGGTLDFISGRVKRAPTWMCRIGLEWLFRLLIQPWRWRRMLALPQFVWLVARNKS